jgi:hypothetical protein
MSDKGLMQHMFKKHFPDPASAMHQRTNEVLNLIKKDYDNVTFYHTILHVSNKWKHEHE